MICESRRMDRSANNYDAKNAISTKQHSVRIVLPSESTLVPHYPPGRAAFSPKDVNVCLDEKELDLPASG